MDQLNVAYVTASRNHIDFNYESNKLGCLEFCCGLPGYNANQIAMMTGQSSSADDDRCICLYQNGMVPSSDSLLEYATSSPPSFYLVHPTTGATLGLSGDSNCTANDTSIELKDHVSTIRQQFQLTYDQRIVSAACPGKVLTANCDEGTLVFSLPAFSNPSTPDAQLQQQQ